MTSICSNAFYGCAKLPTNSISQNKTTFLGEPELKIQTELHGETIEIIMHLIGETELKMQAELHWVIKVIAIDLIGVKNATF